MSKVLPVSFVDFFSAPDVRFLMKLPSLILISFSAYEHINILDNFRKFQCRYRSFFFKKQLNSDRVQVMTRGIVYIKVKLPMMILSSIQEFITITPSLHAHYLELQNNTQNVTMFCSIKVFSLV